MITVNNFVNNRINIKISNQTYVSDCQPNTQYNRMELGLNKNTQPSFQGNHIAKIKDYLRHKPITKLKEETTLGKKVQILQKQIVNRSILEGGIYADDLTDIAPFARKITESQQIIDAANRIKQIEKVLTEKMINKNSEQELMHIKEIINKVTLTNLELINIMINHQNINNALTAEILDSCSDRYQIDMRRLVPLLSFPITLPLWFLQGAGIIGDIKIDSDFKKEYAKKLLLIHNISKDTIPGILKMINKRNIKIIEAALNVQNFDFNVLPMILHSTLEPDNPRSSDNKKIKFAETLINNKDIPNNCIADIVHKYYYVNPEFVKSLCNNKDFPPQQISMLLENIISTREGTYYLMFSKNPGYKLKLAKRLIADPNCPNEYITDIIGAIEKNQKHLFEKIYVDNNIPKSEIANILYLDYIFKKELSKLDIREKVLFLTNALAISDKTMLYLKKYNIDKIKIDEAINKISIDMGLKKENISTTEENKKLLFKKYINNHSNIEETLANVNLEAFTKGIPIKYPRASFIQDVENILYGFNLEDRTIILNHFDLKLENGKMEGFPIVAKNLTDIDKRLLPTIKKINEKVIDFTQQNESSINNPEVKEIFDSIIKGCPEFTTIIGKTQHGTHKYTVDVHTLKVLQNLFHEPEYKMLDDESKTVVKFAILLHDIGKKEGVVDKTHYETSAKYAISILNRYNLPVRVKSRIIETIYNHHWFEQYSANQINAKQVNAIFRTPRDLSIGMLMTKADLAGVSGNFHLKITKTHNENEFNDYFKKQQNELQLYQATRYKNINLVMDTKFNQTDKRHFPTTTVTIDGRQVEIPVLNLADKTLTDNLYDFGFGKNVTKSNARFFAHFNNQIKALKIFIVLSSSPTTESVQSLSMISLNNNKAYKNQTYGIICDIDMANIAQASNRNLSSGNKKDLKHFASDLYNFFQINTYIKDVFINELKKAGITLNDTEYSKLAQQIVNIQYFSQITRDIKIGNKIIPANLLKNILNISREQLFNGDGHSEIVAINPRVKALVARVYSIEECSTEFLELAYKNHLPVILIGRN